MSRTRRTERGFTLVELMISLGAGLMVALAVVGLSREASNVFNDESRVAGAEMQLRSAIDRLRNDVSRAAYMSTGNIWIDPAINTTATGAGASASSNVANIPAPFQNASHMSLYSLAGIRLFVGGSAAATPLSAMNGVNPDAIEIGGNMTSVEELAVGAKGAPGNGVMSPLYTGGAFVGPVDGNNQCNGQTLYLNTQSSQAIWRLVGLGQTWGAVNTLTNPQMDAAVAQAFDPLATPNASGPATASGFYYIVKITNRSLSGTQNTQYGVTCNKRAAGWDSSTNQPAVYLDNTNGVNIALPVGGGGDTVTVNPVHIVRWQIGAAQIADPMSDGGINGPKYDLTRQFLDAFGNPAGSPEVVAEYAVDMKFAFTEDTTTDTTGQYLGVVTPTQVVYSFEDGTDNGNLATDPTTITLGVDGPQRIRSVRIRLVTRAPTPDRTASIDAGTDYVYHYCVSTTASDCSSGGPFFARARTIITEAALQNQARFWYR